ncbi:hypothetical protein CSHISOI_09374, partial [Colletotrichum shisoi]
LVPRADPPHPPLARHLGAARRLGHGLRPPAALVHAGRPPPLAAVGPLRALRRGRPGLRLEGLQRPQRLHLGPGRPQRRRELHVPRLRMAVLLVRQSPRGRPRGRREEDPRREGGRPGHCHRLQRRRHDVEQDGPILGERVLLRLRQHRPQPVHGSFVSLDHPQRRLAPRLGLHDVFSGRRNRRRPGPGFQDDQDR